MTTEDWREFVYRKVATRLWKDPDFLSLDEGCKLVTLYLLTSPQTNACGYFVLSKGAAAEEIGTLPQTFDERFEVVCQTFGWKYSERSRVLWIPSWWRYNEPKNSNIMKGNLKALSEVPANELDASFFNNLADMKPNIRQTFTQTIADRYPKRYPKLSPIQDQDQDQDQDSGAHRPDAGAREKDGGGDPEGADSGGEHPDRDITDEQAAFDLLTKEYPPQGFVKVLAIQRAFHDLWRMKQLPPMATFFGRLAAWKASSRWTEDGGKYIPGCEKWLSDGSWKRDPPASFGARHRSTPDLERRKAGHDPELESELKALFKEGGIAR